MADIYTKYCMTAKGRFVLMNKMSGLDHGQLSLLLDEEPVSAGFVALYDGSLMPYSKSVTLNMGPGANDALVINEALRKGEIHSFYDNLTDFFVATTCDHLKVDPGFETLESLAEKRIIG